jgi:predicted DNA-binding transcriptional regulator YafY
MPFADEDLDVYMRNTSTGPAMNRIDRLTAILMQLQTRRILPGKAIAERFGISLRTVYRDIRTLEHSGVPIGVEPGQGYFLAPGYHLPPVMFTDQQARALLLGGKLIEKFSGLATNLHYACALDKIKAAMGDPKKESLDALCAHIQVLKPSFLTPEAISQDLLPDILAILARNQVAHISYTSGYKCENTRRAIEPLGLCFYGEYWHLLAFCRLRQDYRDFRLDRIHSVELPGENFDPSRRKDLSGLIEKMIHASEMKSACVRFDKSIMPYVGNQKYYFGLVEEKEAGSQVEMHFLTASYDHLSHWLLCYVDTVEVISPQALKQLMAEHAVRLFAHYHPSD